MKKIFSFLVLVPSLLGIGFLQPVLAADTTESSDATITPPAVTLPLTSTEATVNVKTEKSLPRLIKRGEMLIDARLWSLSQLKTKLNGNSKLTTDQKSSLSAMIDEQSTKLTALKAQIKTSTDLTAAKALVASIYTDYRIYAVFIPKIKLMIALDLETNHSAKIATYFVKVQARIDAAKAKGKDVTARQAALDKAKADLVIINTKITDLMTKTGSLMPADYPATYKTTISSIRTGIKEINTQFRLMITLGRRMK